MIPFLIAGAVGFGIAKLLEEDTKKFADGGETRDEAINKKLGIPNWDGAGVDYWYKSLTEVYANESKKFLNKLKKKKNVDYDDVVELSNLIGQDLTDGGNDFIDEDTLEWSDDDALQVCYAVAEKWLKASKIKLEYAEGGEAGNDQEIYDQAIIVATEDIDGMSDEEIADYLGIEWDEVDYQYRNDAIDKRVDELVDLWKKEEYAEGGRVKNIWVYSKPMDKKIRFSAENMSNDSWIDTKSVVNMSKKEIEVFKKQYNKYGKVYIYDEKGKYAGGGETSRKGTYTGRIVNTEIGELMIGKISGYRASGEPVYDTHKFYPISKQMGEKKGELGNNKIKELLKSNKYAGGGEAGSFSYDYYEVYDESTGKSLMIYAIDQEDAESIAEELDFESFEDGDEYNPNEDEYADVGVIEVVGKGNKGTFRNFEGENMTEKEVIQWGKERGYTEKEVIQWLKEKTFAEGGKLKVGKDDFSFLLKLSDKELSKRLDLIRKQQVINGKQYLDAKKKGGNTTKIEESGKRLSNQENAIIQARMRVNKMAKGGEAGKKYILLGYSATASKDSYEEGELEDVGDWDENFSKEFSNKKDLINYINKNILYVDYDESHFDWETGEGKNIQTDVLCTYDDYNGYYPADEKAKQLWKKGKKELFNVHYWINVQAVIPTAYKRGGEIEFKRGKGRGVVKEVYFKGAIRPSFYVSYDNDENDIKKGLKSWCKTHNYNYDDIIKVKYAEGGETGVHSFQAGDKVIFNQDPSGRIGDNIYYGTILEINNGVAKIDHQNSNMKNVIRNVNIANLKKYADGGELAKPISFTEEKKGWYFVEFSDGINVFVDFTLPEFANQRTKKYIFQQAIHNYKRELEEETPYQVYNQETSNVEGYFDNEIEAEEFASQFKNASVYDLRKYAEGGSVSKGYNVFNYTDDIYATDEVFKTKKLANDFIKEFRSRFSKQGYYRDNQMNKIDVKDIDLLAIPSDFNPFGKAI